MEENLEQEKRKGGEEFPPHFIPRRINTLHDILSPNY